MDDMTGNAGSKRPQAIINKIIMDVLRGSRYNQRPTFDFFPGGFHDLIPMYRPPAYAGLLLASKAVIKEIQRLLYKESVFRA